MARGKPRSKDNDSTKGNSSSSSGPPPSYPQENYPEHRSFLIRSLERNDVDLAALTELNRSLHLAKQYIISTCGELVLLDLGQGRLTLINDELHDTQSLQQCTKTTIQQGNTTTTTKINITNTSDEEGIEGTTTEKDVPLPTTSSSSAALTTTITKQEEDGKVEPVVMGESSSSSSRPSSSSPPPSMSPTNSTTTSSNSAYSLTPKQKELCVDFLLRMKLRRKLLNRMARRLNRLAHAMDGEDVAPPAPPKYGDLRLHIDPKAIPSFVQRWEQQQKAQQALKTIKEEQQQQLLQQQQQQQMLLIQQKEQQSGVLSKQEEDDNKEETSRKEEMTTEEHVVKKEEEADQVMSLPNNDKSSKMDDSPKTSDETAAAGSLTDENKQDSTTQPPASSSAEEEEKEKNGVPKDPPSSDSLSPPQDQDKEAKEEEQPKTDPATTTAPPDPVETLSSQPPKPDPPTSSATTTGSNLAMTVAATPPIEPAFSLLPPELQNVLREYDDCYEKQWDPTAKAVQAVGGGGTTTATASSSSTVKYTILDEESQREEDHNVIKFGAGIGATNASMSAREREADYKRWQTALLSRIPEQPTFEDLGLQHRVFCWEERKKRALEDVEESPRKKPKTLEEEEEEKVDDANVNNVKKKLDMDNVVEDDGNNQVKKDEKDQDGDVKMKASNSDDDKAKVDKVKEDSETEDEDFDDKKPTKADGDDKGKKTKAEDDKMEEDSDAEVKTKKEKKKKKEDDDSDVSSSSDMFAADDDDDDEDDDDDDTDQKNKKSNKKNEDSNSDMDEDSDDSEEEQPPKKAAGDEAPPVVEEKQKIKIQPRKEFLKPGTANDDKTSSGGGGDSQNKGDTDNKKEKDDKKKKEEEEKTEPKRMKIMNLAPVPSFYEQDLKRIRMIHEDLMSSSRHEHGRRRLSEATIEYNKAFRISNEMYEARQSIQQQLTNFLYECRTKMSKLKQDYAMECAIARSRYQKQKQEHVKQQAKSSMPSNWGSQPVGTSATLNFIRNNPGIPSIVGQCVADLVDGAILRLEGKVKVVKFRDFVPPPAPDLNKVVNKQTGESIGQQQLRYENELRQQLNTLTARYQHSEEERKKAWKKMLKTKAEFEMPHMHQLAHGQFGNVKRSGNIQVDLTNYHLVPLPPLRTSTQQILPQQVNAARSSLASYTPTPRSTPVASSTTKGGPGESDSKYSAARVKERIGDDGTVAPVSEPKKTRDGLYMRPAGRTRKGMQWDALKGIWVPEGSQ